MKQERGFTCLAIYNSKNVINIGTLFRTAHVLGIDSFCVIKHRYRSQPGDTPKSTRSIPMFYFDDFEDFYKAMPLNARLIGIEMTKDAIHLRKYTHPQQGIYLLGAEDNGIPKEILKRCHDVIRLSGEKSMNVSVAGSIVLYDKLGE